MVWQHVTKCWNLIVWKIHYTGYGHLQKMPTVKDCIFIVKCVDRKSEVNFEHVLFPVSWKQLKGLVPMLFQPGFMFQVNFFAWWGTYMTTDVISVTQQPSHCAINIYFLMKQQSKQTLKLSNANLSHMLHVSHVLFGKPVSIVLTNLAFALSFSHYYADWKCAQKQMDGDTRRANCPHCGTPFKCMDYFNGYEDCIFCPTSLLMYHKGIYCF